MVLVDTCGWIEWITDGKLCKSFDKYLKKTSELIIPTIVQFELYKWACRERDEITALNIMGVTEHCKVISIDTNIALTAADIATQCHLFPKKRGKRNLTAESDLLYLLQYYS